MLRGAIVYLLMIGVGGAPALTEGPQDAKLTKYDVISVHQNMSGSLNSSFRPSPNGLSVTNFTVKQFMVFAFGLRSPSFISGLPGWADSARFDVVAKLDDDTFAALSKLSLSDANEHRKLMMQQILVDRFHLITHHEKKESPAYALAIAKTGLKIKEPDPEKLKNPGAGYQPGKVRILKGEFVGQAISLDLFARALSLTFVGPVSLSSLLSRRPSDGSSCGRRGKSST